jgi:isopentenyl diphosphate isomerase/L-lactate dehydrogenase-like FMN-dependent dehydrogenase
MLHKLFNIKSILFLVLFTVGKALASGTSAVAMAPWPGYGLLSSGARGVARSLRVSAAIMRIETSTCDGMMRA